MQHTIRFVSFSYGMMLFQVAKYPNAGQKIGSIMQNVNLILQIEHVFSL
jgi:hypothetical protein